MSALSMEFGAAMVELGHAATAWLGPLGHAATAWLGPLGHAATAWLGTYLVHSTVLLGAAWLATRVVASPRRREVVWRAALLGGLATASVQVGLDLRPALGRFELGTEIASVGNDPPSALGDTHFDVAELALPPLVNFAASPATIAPEAAPELTWWSSALTGFARRDLRHVGPTALALGALFAVGSIACGVLVLARRRRGQTRLVSGPLAEAFAKLTAGSRNLRHVELWLCGRSDTPYAAGVLRARIVVPARVLSDLAPGEQRALLAHELAHIERRDPVWLGLTRALQLCLPLQPLNSLARRHLNGCAELLCDERAIERTGDRLALAQSLAKVASWLVADDRLPDAACAMASHRSLLGIRVARILDEDNPTTKSVQPLRVALLLALAGTAIAAPAVRLAARVEPGTPETAPAPSGLASLGFAAAPDTAAVVQAADALNDVARRELAALAVTLDEAVDELEAELAALKSASAGRALDPALAARVAMMEQRASEVRSRAKRIRALLTGAPSGGVEAPRGERRRRAAAPTTPTRAR
jgi:beta-lactamase regulating signal transducer with metallopeptidase domain